MILQLWWSEINPEEAQEEEEEEKEEEEKNKEVYHRSRRSIPLGETESEKVNTFFPVYFA